MASQLGFLFLPVCLTCRSSTSDTLVSTYYNGINGGCMCYRVRQQLQREDSKVASDNEEEEDLE